MKRLDQVVALQFDISRSKALDYIKQNQITVNDRIISKASYQVNEGDMIRLNKMERFVSRGGDKLFKMIKKLNLDVSDKICLDVGASTGGFSDCLLQMQASLVIAVDVGSNQLHESLKGDPRLQFYENTNINHVNNDDFNHKFDIIVVDVSFTSLKIIFEKVASLLKDDGQILWLFKPQFEVGKEFLNKKGIVKQEDFALKALDDINLWIQSLGYQLDTYPSELKGKNGNQEYFLHIY